MVLSVSEQTFTQEVLESAIPVLVNFEAPWCGLCRIIQPLLLQFRTQYNGQIKLVRVNADENFKLSNAYKLKSLPTLLLIENGIVKYRLESFRAREDLLLALEVIKDSCAHKSSQTYIGNKVPDLEYRSA
ncbi:thioredoxin domain-containing protein [Mastigocoleus sp. MO_188.B34]|uniref:thioredoxin family protein n=1 Tax=Mastigocoleus sp. MO_188.B34 TaxID=3036635 RepID=UPI002606A6BC|nr:thioredoxin domain-containing protein [Mastigocoleus sp. MO_188.B34]MDJ0697041.1 thioredoxin domain-containing protein [Mastigocoleus sp. MO_188.B34]